MLLLTHSTKPVALLPAPDVRVTHEEFIGAIYKLVCDRADPETRATLEAIKLVYGSGPHGTRGVTYHARWRNCGHDHSVPFVEISAFGERDWIQLAGTTIHELGHVMAGVGHGHDKHWKECCAALGLHGIQAAGTDYQLDMFDADLAAALVAMPKPNDGAPDAGTDLTALFGVMGRAFKLKPCTAGQGVRGGKSRGAGSGSRLVKVSCDECGYTVRVTRKWLDVGAPHCGAGHGPMAEPDDD